MSRPSDRRSTVRKAALAAIAALVEENPAVVFIGSDLGAGTLADAARRHPDRVLMEGIAEQHIVGCAAGLALEGFIPYVHTISTFLTRRALEQVIVDVALHNLPVRLVGAGGGMVYAPLGPTHEAIDDFALMRAIPRMSVIAPADPREMTECIRHLASASGPAYVRIAKGGEPDVTRELPQSPWGQPRVVLTGDTLAVLTTGALLHECLPAVQSARQGGHDVGLWHIPVLAPVAEGSLDALLAGRHTVLVVEEHIPTGGLSTIVAEAIAERGLPTRLHRLTLPHRYPEKYGSQREHWELHGLSAAGITARIEAILRD